MAEIKRLMAGFGCREGKVVLLDGSKTPCGYTLQELAHEYNNNGADGLLIRDLSVDDADHERTIGMLREAVRQIDIPVITGGRVKRMEDVKKYLYTGAEAVFLDGSDMGNIDLIKEVSSRFGSERIYIDLPDAALIGRVEEFTQLGASAMLLHMNACTEYEECLGAEAFSALKTPVYAVCKDASQRQISACMSLEQTAGVILTSPLEAVDYIGCKQLLHAQGIVVDILQSAVSWEQFRTDGSGLVPVIVQDYKTSEVLMLAYMNEQAFADTLRTGQMHYYSRSRKKQWHKGETSGHYQYVKSLHLDCDNDTLLARVHQIGAACHTGSRSCFFQTLAKKQYKETNPLKVFEEVFAVIRDRKVHPKEGSYTNYLFDKGIDKILKKCGEEMTEIVIAAKNPDPEEVKYEISDFLYHMMVLMAEKGVTWEDITGELANR